MALHASHSQFCFERSGPSAEDMVSVYSAFHPFLIFLHLILMLVQAHLQFCHVL